MEEIEDGRKKIKKHLDKKEKFLKGEKRRRIKKLRETNIRRFGEDNQEKKYSKLLLTDQEEIYQQDFNFCIDHYYDSSITLPISYGYFLNKKKLYQTKI